MALNSSLVNAAVKAAYAAGFRNETLVMAVAIAGAESAWNPSAVGDVQLGNDSAKWGNSIGLFQIRSLDPAYLHLEPLRNAEKLYDPFYNAEAAFKISDGGIDWQPWGAYTNQSYLRHMTEARDAVNAFMDSMAPLITDVKKKPCPYS